MKKISIFVMAFSLFSLFSCKGYQDLSVEDFAQALTPASRILDVRTADEFVDGHLRGAVNADWYGETFMDQVQELFDKTAPLYVYCRSGKRSASASVQLSKAGYQVFNLSGGYLAWTAAGREVTRYEVERFSTPSGKTVELTLIKHGSLEIRYQEQSFQIDPVAELGRHTDYATEFPKADFILVTHEHGDHLDPAAIDAVSNDNTLLILNGTSQKKIGQGEVMANDQHRSLAGNILLEAVPAYNTTPGREMFHPKGNGNGYVLNLDGFRVYIAGDTEDVPEMAALKDIDVALLPVNQPYTMTVEQCVKAATVIAPKVLIPYHFGQTDITSLPYRLPGIDVRLRQMQ